MQRRHERRFVDKRTARCSRGSRRGAAARARPRRSHGGSPVSTAWMVSTSARLEQLAEAHPARRSRLRPQGLVCGSCTRPASRTAPLRRTAAPIFPMPKMPRVLPVSDIPRSCVGLQPSIGFAAHQPVALDDPARREHQRPREIGSRFGEDVRSVRDDGSARGRSCDVDVVVIPTARVATMRVGSGVEQVGVGAFGQQAEQRLFAA